MLSASRSYEEARRSFVWRIPARINAAVEAIDRHCGAAADADRTILAAPGADGRMAHASFRTLKRDSDRLAGALAALMVEPGSRVATVLPLGFPAALTALATLKAGGVVAPMAESWPDGILAAAIAEAAPRVVVTGTRRLAAVKAATAALEQPAAVLAVGTGEDGAADFQSLLDGAPERPLRVETGADDPAFLVFSQGRTGPMKGIVHAHRALLAARTALEMVFEDCPQTGDRLWCGLSPGHPFGLILGLFAPWALGIPVVATGGEGRAGAEEAFAAFAEEGVRRILVSPAGAAMLMRRPTPRLADRLPVRSAAVAGGRLPEAAERWWVKTFGFRPGRLYGEAETGAVAATRPAWFADSGFPALGRAVPGVGLDVVNREGEVLAPGTPGHLAVRLPFPGLFLDYARRDSLTRGAAAQKFAGSRFLTGDLAVADDTGDLTFVAKADDVLPDVRAGFLPDAAEASLSAHPLVRSAALVALPDAAGRPEIVACVVPARGMRPGDAKAEAQAAAEILAHAARTLAPVARPRRIVFVAEIPMTDEGRPHRAAIRERIEKTKPTGTGVSSEAPPG